MMTKDELAGCLRALRAYFPGDWDGERLMVWSDVLLEFDHQTAIAAVRDLGRNDRYPTVAALLEHAKARRPWTGHLPGSGFIAPFTAAPLELPATPEDREAAIVHIADARSRLRPIAVDAGTLPAIGSNP